MMPRRTRTSPTCIAASPAAPFEHRFQLADHVRVNGAHLANGLLDIELVREVPEAMKPQRIEIGAGTAKPKVIEGKVKAA